MTLHRSPSRTQVDVHAGSSAGREARLAGVSRCVCALAATVAGLLVFATPVLAANPPAWEKSEFEQEVFSTRIAMRGYLASDHGITTEWRTEYSTNRATVEKGEGTAAGEGKGEGGVLIWLGTGRDMSTGGTSERTNLRHLTPGTVYYARFFAKNADGEASEIVPFKTLPVGKPEIPRIPSVNEVPVTLGVSTFRDRQVSSPRSQEFDAQVESNGAETEYRFEYAPAELNGQPPSAGSLAWQVCSSGATGTITVAQDFAEPTTSCEGLIPETSYFARLRATNSQGTVEEVLPFKTATARPEVYGTEVRNPTGVSAHLEAEVFPHETEMEWRFEFTTEPANPGSWQPVPGAAGTITLAQSDAVPFNDGVTVDGELPGLSPSTVYYVRLYAQSAVGEGVIFGGEPIRSTTRAPTSFRTSGAPRVGTFATHAIHGESLRLLGFVNPDSLATSAEQTITIAGEPTGGTFTLSFEGHTTTPIPYDATTEQVGQALGGIAPVSPGDVSGYPGPVAVTGRVGGPYTVYFRHSDTSEPQLQADGSALVPATSVDVAVTQQGGEAYDTHYHFEYEQRQAGVEPFTHATQGPTVDAGSGDTAQIVSVDLPGPTPGAAYRYRLVASSNSPGNPVVDGQEQSLTIPGASDGKEEAAVSCPNEASRSGLGAHLPDCRAYEQITPVYKEGALEIFKYATTANGGVLYGEDGEHVMFAANETHWGTGVDSGSGPYFFSRTAEGWRLVSAAPAREAGIEHYEPEILSSDLTQMGFAASWQTSATTVSPTVEFGAGPPGGPYVKVAVPRHQVGSVGGWVAASADLSKRILMVEDHTLLGHSTRTAHGNDLYEWSGGELRQLNVTGPAPGTTIGSCGAEVADGLGGPLELSGSTARSNIHAVSTDGARVFFEAVPGSNCGGETSHLYMRVAGTETVDIGAYRFLAADAEGSRVLLERLHGQASEVFLYDTEDRSVKALFTVPDGLGPSGEKAEPRVSEELGVIYFMSSAQLLAEAPSGLNIYRYDIQTEQLRFVIQAERVVGDEVSPDGRYLYFNSPGVAGVLNKAVELKDGEDQGEGQRFRYDSAENVVECISCASPFDPEPRFGAETSNTPGGALDAYASSANGRPQITLSSADGDFSYFETVAALVPQDVNGEVPLADVNAGEPIPEDPRGSPSNDVYQWSRDGIDGCGHLQGCLSLITPGTFDGGQVVLLGVDPSGRDVFFYTRSRLVPQDLDTQGDLYDARVNGGFAVAARPVECEGNTCSSPEGQPNDATPSSYTFSGSGNLANGPEAPVKPATKSKAKAKRKTKQCKSATCRKRQKRRGKAKRSARRSRR